MEHAGSKQLMIELNLRANLTSNITAKGYDSRLHYNFDSIQSKTFFQK